MEQMKERKVEIKATYGTERENGKFSIMLYEDGVSKGGTWMEVTGLPSYLEEWLVAR